MQELLLTKIRVGAPSCLSLNSNMNLTNFPNSDLPYFCFLYRVWSIYKCTFLTKLEVNLDLFFSFYRDIDVFFLTCLVNSVNHKSFLMETTCLPSTV